VAPAVAGARQEPQAFPAPPTPPLPVVIVHRNRPELCARTVGAFLSQDLPVAITIVDNGSAPAALHDLRRRAPAAEVVATGRNLGFGPGVNVGLRHWLASGNSEWVAIAPHDAVPQPGCLQRILVEVQHRPGVGLASAEYGPGFDFLPVFDKVLGAFYRPTPRGDGWQAADYAHGTLLLLRRAAVEQVGLFDERYFAYCEEVDLGVRARKAGWEVGIVWGAVVANQQFPGPGVAEYLQTRNTLLLVREAFGRYFAGWRFGLALGHLARVALRSRLAGPGVRLQAGALADFARGRFGPPPAWVTEAG
jgi:N-acetylglucosaminyl-diphospho-decaprenol L-rhamnosyltransferase